MGDDANGTWTSRELLGHIRQEESKREFEATHSYNCIVCGPGRLCKCKPGNPYPAIYRELEAMEHEFAVARMQTPLGQVARVRYHAKWDFMDISRTLASRWR